MASNRPSIAPGEHANSALRAAKNAQQRTPYFDAQRGNVATVNDTVKHVRILVERNRELQSQLVTLTKKVQQQEAECVEVISSTKEKVERDVKEKVEKDVKEQYEVKLAESLQNYEDAKVVVLTYKTQNIRLQSVADHNQTEIANLKAKVQVQYINLLVCVTT